MNSQHHHGTITYQLEPRPNSGRQTKTKPHSNATQGAPATHDSCSGACTTKGRDPGEVKTSCGGVGGSGITRTMSLERGPAQWWHLVGISGGAGGEASPAMAPPRETRMDQASEPPRSRERRGGSASLDLSRPLEKVENPGWFQNPPRLVSRARLCDGRDRDTAMDGRISAVRCLPGPWIGWKPKV